MHPNNTHTCSTFNKYFITLALHSSRTIKGFWDATTISGEYVIYYSIKLTALSLLLALYKSNLFRDHAQRLQKLILKLGLYCYTIIHLHFDNLFQTNTILYISNKVSSVATKQFKVCTQSECFNCSNSEPYPGRNPGHMVECSTPTESGEHIIPLVMQYFSGLLGFISDAQGKPVETSALK